MKIDQTIAEIQQSHCSTAVLTLINDKNCSLTIVLTAMDQKLQKS